MNVNEFASVIEPPRPEREIEAVYVDALVARLIDQGGASILRQSGRDTTAADFLESIYRYARALSILGIKRGSVVALLVPNRVEALAVRYAASLLGAASTFLAVPRTTARLTELIVQINPALIIVFPETAHLLAPDITAPIVGIGTAASAGLRRLDHIAAAVSSEPVGSRARSPDLGIFVCSGGTTGVPKASWRSFAAYTAMLHAPTSAGRRQLINGPLAYLSQVLIDITLIGGGAVILDQGFNPADTLATIEAERITDLFLVEPQLFALMDHADVGRRDLSSLRTITHVGGSAPPTLRRRARKRLGAVIVHNYGASEMGIVSTLPAAAHDLADFEMFTSAGKILPGVDIRFRQPDGSLAVRTEPGLIEVRSTALAGGYRNRPELEAAFHDGWYRSGDLGVLDDCGYLHILGRAADIAWIDGAMVSPFLIEETLCRIPSVRYTVVVRDGDTGDWIAAVEPWPGLAIDISLCRMTIAAAYPVVDATIVQVERMPLTEQGKADRSIICRLAQTSEGNGLSEPGPRVIG